MVPRLAATAAPSPARREESIISLAPLAGRGVGEGLFFEFAKKRGENPFQVLDDVIVPEPDHALTQGLALSVALPVLHSFRVLAAVEFDDQAPFTTNKVGIVPIDRLLSDKLEAAEFRRRVHSANSAGVSARRKERARSARC
jgi:hypothetical protein